MTAERTLASGYVYVDSDVFCVLTRFRVRSVWSILRFYYFFRMIRREVASCGIKGLLSSSFVIEDLHTCYTLSFWTSQEAVGRFNGLIRSHIDSANTAIPALSLDASGHPELWSAQMSLDAVSAHNMRWDGLPLAGTYSPRARAAPTRATGQSHG